MLGLFFDVVPKPGHMQAYFDHVARLKPVLERHEGLVFLERFQPLDAPGALLSHQLWSDAAAIDRWRADPDHKLSQAAGRRVHFDAYRIRVGAQMLHLPMDTQDLAADSAGRFVVAAYGTAPSSLPNGRAHESVSRPGQYLTLAKTTDAAQAQGWAHSARYTGAETVRVFAINRDYTMTDRAEAPR
jgi:heme-degrading monooxygenase HmoA